MKRKVLVGGVGAVGVILLGLLYEVGDRPDLAEQATPAERAPSVEKHGAGAPDLLIAHRRVVQRWPEDDPRQALATVFVTQHASLKEERDAYLRALANSSASVDDWTTSITGLFEKWHAAVPGDQRVGIQLSETECFRAGCKTIVTLDSMTAYHPLETAISSVDESGYRRGPIIRTAPDLTSDDKYVLTWIVLRPDDA